MGIQRIDEFLAIVERAGFGELRRLALTTVGPVSDAQRRKLIPVYQHLAFGKTRWHPREAAWLTPLAAAEMRELEQLEQRGLVCVRTSGVAAYPEAEGGWSVLNRVIDLCLVGQRDPVEARWEALQAQAEAARRRQRALVDALLVAYGAADVGIESVAVRGQFGSERRIPATDVDLLLLLRDASCYGPVLERSRQFALDAAVDVGRLSWLATDFNGSEDDGVIVHRGPSGEHSLDLDLYATVGASELARVLRGDPAEARSNLEVLRAARPVWGEAKFSTFVTNYQRVLAIRARGCVAPLPPNIPMSHAPVTATELRGAQARGLEALAKLPPRVEMWDDHGARRAMLSPFVAALMCEAGAREIGARYLEQTMEPGGIWRFAPHADDPWPPDVDDTVCAAAALHSQGRLTVEAAAFVGQLEARRTGDDLLETWLIDPEQHPGRHNDADPIVTANALLFLHRVGHGQAPLARTLEAGVLSAIRRGPVRSSYYQSTLVQAAFIARWAAEARTPVSLDVLGELRAWLSAVDVRVLSAMELAAVVAAASWSADAELVWGAVPRLLATQEPSGLWAPGVAFVDPGGGRYGSQALTTAVALAGLAASESYFT